MLAEINWWRVLFIPGGGPIGGFLWLLSIVMVGMVIQVFIAIRRLTILPPVLQGQVSELFKARQFGDVIQLTADDPSYFAALIRAALAEASRGYHAMEKALQEEADNRTTRYLRSVEYLNLLGNIAPMIGLLGTVLGMIMAFFTIVDKGGIPSPAELADALGIKLVCTFVGLLVAIPSLTVYGLIRNRIDILCTEGLVTAQSLIMTLRPGKDKAASNQ